MRARYLEETICSPLFSLFWQKQLNNGRACFESLWRHTPLLWRMNDTSRSMIHLVTELQSESRELWVGSQLSFSFLLSQWLCTHTYLEWAFPPPVTQPWICLIVTTQGSSSRSLSILLSWQPNTQRTKVFCLCHVRWEKISIYEHGSRPSLIARSAGASSLNFPTLHSSKKELFITSIPQHMIFSFNCSNWLRHSVYHKHPGSWAQGSEVGYYILFLAIWHRVNSRYRFSFCLWDYVTA